MINKVWGYLREDLEDAIKAGVDKDTGLQRTSLLDYLEKIFPDITDWVHDRVIPNSGRMLRPDYRSESLKLIVEFDGLPHYNNPDNIIRDRENTILYNSLGYRVIRIPYFIQLSNKVIKKLFNVNIEEMMFDESYASLSIINKSTPAYLCYNGIKRMAREFKEISLEQYLINLNYLKSLNNQELTNISQLEYFYDNNQLSNQI